MGWIHVSSVSPMNNSSCVFTNANVVQRVEHRQVKWSCWWWWEHSSRYGETPRVVVVAGTHSMPANIHLGTVTSSELRQRTGRPIAIWKPHNWWPRNRITLSALHCQWCQIVASCMSHMAASERAQVCSHVCRKWMSRPWWHASKPSKIATGRHSCGCSTINTLRPLSCLLTLVRPYSLSVSILLWIYSCVYIYKCWGTSPLYVAVAVTETWLTIELLQKGRYDLNKYNNHVWLICSAKHIYKNINNNNNINK